MKINRAYIGRWRLIEMSTWDQDFIDLVRPGHLTVNTDASGQLAFGAIEAHVDFRMEKVGQTARLAFSFAGRDEGDEATGNGWATVRGDEMQGWLGFHLGDDTTFRAKRPKGPWLDIHEIGPVNP